MEPSADLSPEQVLSSVFRGLQFVDLPHENAGLERCYAFMTLEARVSASGAGRQLENRGVDLFVERGGLFPSLRPFIGASKLEFGEVTIIPATQTRGAMASVSVKVVFSPLTATRHPCGIPREAVVELPESAFAIRMQQQRRPPLSGAWLITHVNTSQHGMTLG